MANKRLNIPLRDEDIRELEVGDLVTFDGLIFTGRSRFHIRAIAEDILPPIDFGEMNVFVHMGPVVLRTGDGWQPIGLGPTSSVRFERYSPAVIRKLRLKAVIGKTTVREPTIQAMEEVGCIHACPLGAASMGTVLATRAEVVDVFFKDELGATEATWVFRVKNWGPFMVDTDAHGNNYFLQADVSLEERMNRAYTRLGISHDFEYTRA